MDDLVEFTGVSSRCWPVANTSSNRFFSSMPSGPSEMAERTSLSAFAFSYRAMCRSAKNNSAGIIRLSFGRAAASCPPYFSASSKYSRIDRIYGHSET